MAYTVRLKKSAEKELEALPAKIRNRIVTVLLSLQDNPIHDSRADPTELPIDGEFQFKVHHARPGGTPRGASGS
jgi:mRNA-degrading endonuclease RelE of RelBE toxin-antitoxin system